MSTPNQAPGRGALSPEICAAVVRELSGALDGALDVARFTRAALRDPATPAAERVEAADVWLGALVDRVTQAGASVVTLPGVWALVSAQRPRYAEPPPAPPPGWPAQAWAQIPAVVDADAAIERKRRADAGLPWLPADEMGGGPPA